MPIQLEDLATIKLHLGLTTLAHDDLILSIIQQVSAVIESYLNRSLEKQQYTEYFNGGHRFYYLKAYPIDKTQTLTVTVDDTIKTIDDDYYVWEDEGLIEFDYIPSDSKPKTVEVIYTGGYAKTNNVLAVPDDLKRACTLEVMRAYQNRNKLGLTSISYPDGSTSLMDLGEFLPETKKILRRHRRIPSVK